VSETPRKTWRLKSLAGAVVVVRRRDLQSGERVIRWSEQNVEQMVYEARTDPWIWQTLLELYETVQGTAAGAGGGGEPLRRQVSRIVGAAFGRGEFVVLRPEPVFAAPSGGGPQPQAQPAPAPGPGPMTAPAERAALRETPPASSASASSVSSLRSSSSLSSSSSSSACAAQAGHFYSGAQKRLPGLVGYECSITAKATVLPCEPTATFDAFSATWTGITKADISKWCQVGFTRRRYSPNTAVNFWTKVEVNAGPAAADYYYHTHAAPAIGSNDTYRGELDPDTGKWEVYLNGTRIDQFTNAGWRNDTGDRVDYQGEVFDENSQIAGTSADHCAFSNCRFRTATRRSSSSSRSSSSARSSSSSGGPASGWNVGAWTNAGLTAANCHTTNAAKWGNTRIDGQTIEIWDKRR